MRFEKKLWSPWFINRKSLSIYEYNNINASIYEPECHQEHVGRARTTSYQRYCGVYTRGATLTFLHVLYRCAQKLTHKIKKQRSSCALAKFLTNSDARPTNNKAHTNIAHFLVRWTCVKLKTQQHERKGEYAFDE